MPLSSCLSDGRWSQTNLRVKEEGVSRTKNHEMVGGKLKGTSKNLTLPGLEWDTKHDLIKWKIVWVLVQQRPDTFYGYVIGLTTNYIQHILEARKKKEANSNSNEDNMERNGKDATKKGKRDTRKNIVEGVRGPN